MSRPLLILACWMLPITAAWAEAGVMVVANRSPAAVTCSFVEPGGMPRESTIAAGDSLPIRINASGRLTFSAAGAVKEYNVARNCIYYFGTSASGAVDLGQIGVALAENPPPPAPPLASQDTRLNDDADPDQTLVIPVKICFDQDEISPQATWEKRMRARFEEVSRIFKRHCFVEFRIVAIDHWHADPTLSDIDVSLHEFERAIDPAPAQVAIGFAGRHQPNRAYSHLGGTRGPLASHLLIREWANRNSEPERLEILVHELGHYLGAVHSPEGNSVMRVKLGDRQARLTKFRIGFDPLNTLAMCLVRDELAVRPQLRVSELRPATQAELRKIYLEFAKAMPGDPSAIRYLRLVSVTHPVLPPLGRAPR